MKITKAQRKRIRSELEAAGWIDAKPYCPKFHEAIKELDFFQEVSFSALGMRRYFLLDPERKDNPFFIILDPSFQTQWGFLYDKHPCAVCFEYVFDNSSEEIREKLIWNFNLFK